MITPDDIPHWIEQIDKLNMWLHTVPLPEEYRKRTTYREFRELVKAKREELGLTQEVLDQLRPFEDENEDLRWAWTEVGMTEDNRELVCSTYEQDLPMHFYWMDEYDPMQKAISDYMDAQPLYTGVPDEVLLEIVRNHLPVIADQKN